MRLVILQSMERWDKAAEIAIGAVRYYPESQDLFLIGAYPVRRAEDVKAAFEFLQLGCGCLMENGTYWFNRGCYHCQLGELEDAKTCIKTAVELDKRFQEMAIDDDDLEPLWDELAGV